MAIEEEDHHEDDQPTTSDDDDAPEEVGKETAKKGALEQLEREHSAKVAAVEAAKSKRRAEIERNTEQQRAKRERKIASTNTSAGTSLNSIPDDLLAKVSAKRKEEDSGVSEPESIPSPKKRPQNKRTTVFDDDFEPRELETEATTFTAVNLAKAKELDNPITAMRKDKSSCFNFRNRMLFDKKRLRRIHSGTAASYQSKRAVSSRQG
ncbi:hypothetical protein TYRP_009068 [Tyrophagus putrescentiae]|nr:hypothetical protein TYRP_009068 [Tyrophagus putrescentiae]